MDQSLPPEPKMLSAHQEAMVEACKAGQLAELQKLFHEHDVKHGDDPIPYWHAPQEGAPATSTLFAAAISHGQQSIVEYLRSVYPKFDFYDGSIIHSLTGEKPNLDMIKLVCSYSPRIAHFGFDDHTTTFLSLACEGGPQNAPIVDFLVDHGAMADDDFGSYAYHFGVELLPAVQHDQPTEIIKKMIPKTSKLWMPTDVAIRRKRVDVLELLLKEEENRGGTHSSDGKYEQSLLCRAQATEDKKVIAVVERYLCNMEKRATKSKSKSKSKSAARKVRSTRAAMKGRRWWRFGARAEYRPPQTCKADAEDSSSAPLRSGARRWWWWWWWPLSKIARAPKSADVYHQKKEPLDSASEEED
ncbi:hypothetical protein LTR93_003402 [Exophiala xenobiotica]|nr:hypothetical protein LTR93_003402 [Exophiala xenobiotica]KAK5405827.1 hypothetical protein LTR06_008895 [Exophiala xenobiotica]